jgi:hypothetical protein
MSSEYIQLPMLSETIDDSEDTSEHSDDEGNVLDEPECRICFVLVAISMSIDLAWSDGGRITGEL